MALFERGPRKAPLIGKVVGVGLVDEISDHTWVVIDAVDGRVHYAELGRLKPAEVPGRGTLVALAGDSLEGKPSKVPKVQELSPVELESQTTYDGQALAARGQWLAARNLATLSPTGDLKPSPEMMRTLRRSERERVVQGLSHVLNASYIHTEPGTRIRGIYDRAITTPTGKLAIIRSEDTFTLAPWRPVLEPFRGQAVTGVIGPNRVAWSLDRGRTLPGRT
jgi:hypothetical protein